jgi:hypothetical protein
VKTCQSEYLYNTYQYCKEKNMYRLQEFKIAMVLLTCAMLAACTGKIVRVEMDPATPVVCDSRFGTPCGVLNTQAVKFRVWGEGKCDSVGVRLGDGRTMFSPNPYDFGKAGASVSLELTHTYGIAWPGVKSIHAFSAANCMGESFETIRLMRKSGTAIHTDFELALMQPPAAALGQSACADVPSVLPLRANTKVSITTNPDPNIKINFGCLLGGCIYGADGEVGSSAPVNFPFMGLAKYSLVLKVGTQVIQGGSRSTFVTNQSGLLEVCVNDDMLSDNTGAWGISIAVDETQAR